MSEPLPEPPVPETTHRAPEPVDLARKNALWGWALFASFVLLFAATVVIALIYLALD